MVTVRGSGDSRRDSDSEELHEVWTYSSGATSIPLPLSWSLPSSSFVFPQSSIHSYTCSVLFSEPILFQQLLFHIPKSFNFSANILTNLLSS